MGTAGYRKLKETEEGTFVKGQQVANGGNATAGWGKRRRELGWVLLAMMLGMGLMCWMVGMDGEENPAGVPRNCKAYTDGCNSCARSTRSSPFACTLMDCGDDFVPNIHCTKWFDMKMMMDEEEHMGEDVEVADKKKQEIADIQCKRFFDGCNQCSRSVPGGPMACTERFCMEPEQAYCMEEFSPPKNCKVYFDGCNMCHRSSPHTENWACTRKHCHEYQEPDCKEFFPPEEAMNQKASKLDSEFGNCKELFDGCNECSRTEPNGALGCTRMACDVHEEPSCHEWFSTPEKTEKSTLDELGNCKSLFDGCNECSRSEPNGALGCTRMACDIYEEPSCHEWFPATKDNDIDMGQCKSLFDGCNDCHRDEPNGPLACTRMYCEEYRPVECHEWFEIAKVSKERDFGNCKSLFDGCNQCHRSAPNGELACTMMFCPEYEAKKCHEWFPEVVSHDTTPQRQKDASDAQEDFGNCKKLFDGCNQCRRSVPNGELACTRMFCSVYKEKKCNEWF